MAVRIAHNLEELYKALHNASKETRLIAGGTDLTIYIRSHKERKFDLIDISKIPELKKIEKKENHIEIGAAVPYDELESSPTLKRYARALTVASSMVGSTQIRSRGTLGGNLANASAAADGVPSLCSLMAKAVIAASNEEEIVLPVEKVIIGKNKTILTRDQFIKKFIIPIEENIYSDFTKIGSRKAVTISKLNLAFSCQIRKNIENPIIFIGAISPSPTRSMEAEKILTQKGSSKEFIEAIVKTVETTIPGRNSLNYKRKAIEGLGQDIWDHLGDALNDSR